MRPEQWIKNGFVLVPLFFTPSAIDWRNGVLGILGAVSFCALSSSVYIFNDYMDRASDRQHPTKRARPLAAGTVAVPTALTCLAALGLGGLALALLLSPAFGLIAAAYLAVNLLYSVRLKHVAIIDVLVVTLGFILRVKGGAELVDVTLSVWLVVMTGLLALFLALAKRRDDLVLGLGGAQRGSMEGYNEPFLNAALTMVLAALLVAYLIYTTDENVIARFHTDRLVLTTPFVVAGLLRYLQITLVEHRSGSPSAIVLTDRFLIATVLGWLVTFALLLYA